MSIKSQNNKRYHDFAGETDGLEGGLLEIGRALGIGNVLQQAGNDVSPPATWQFDSSDGGNTL